MDSSPKINEDKYEGCCTEVQQSWQLCPVALGSHPSRISWDILLPNDLYPKAGNPAHPND